MAYGVVTMLACTTYEAPELVLDGPEHLRVDRLGPVDGPRVQLQDGTEPEGVIWTLSRDGVAHVENGRLVAEGPGEVQVVAEWEDQRVEWTLLVELGAMLAFVRPPSRIKVGEEVSLQVEARVADRPVDIGAVDWASSDAVVLTVTPGPPASAVGLAAGTADVTASAPGASAMIELEVVP